MDRLRWYVRRLRSMSPAEMVWRAAAVGRAVTATRRREKPDHRLLAAPDWYVALQAFRDGTGRPVLLDRSRAATIAAVHPDAVAALVAAADRFVAGRVRYFGYAEVQLADPVNWHHDPVSGTTWPVVAAARLDHRSADGDAKWIWELNRLQHLPMLAQAWLLTGDDRYADTAWAHLDGWLAQNPPGTGIAWRGAFEAGVRALSVAVALQGLRDSRGLSGERYQAVVRMLAESARRCWADRSRFSSANNHLVGELAGLAVVALLHPELAGAGRALRRALEGLTEQARLQILPDGAGSEQAFAYQIFTGDLLLVVTSLLRQAGRPVPEAIPAALRRSARYLSTVIGDGDPVPRYGDDDEGFALRLDTAEVPDVRSHLAAVAAVTGDGLAARCGTPGLVSAWLGGPDPEPAVPEQVPANLYAPDGGLVVLRVGDRRVTVDVGPLGYLAIAAHGHADALALTLAVDGTELVGDPGAGSYYGHPDWRRAHRSTPAHATVAVDGEDQSVSGGPFLWTRHASVRVLDVDLVAGVVDAEHDGYERLPDPVLHRRWVLAPPEGGPLAVVDLLSGAGVHDVTTAWPLHPDLDVTLDGSAHVVTMAAQPVLRIVHAATTAFTPVQRRGDEPTALGWWSRRLEAREPAWSVGAAVAGSLPLVIATVLQPAPGSHPVAELAVSWSGGVRGDVIGVRWREGTTAHAVTIDPSRPAAVERITRAFGAAPTG